MRHRTKAGFTADGTDEHGSSSISPLEAGEGLGKVCCVTTAVANAIAKMTKRQKLALPDRLLADTGAHDKPSYLHSSDDPALDAVLKRRLNDRSPGAWLSLDEFRARTMATAC